MIKYILLLSPLLFVAHTQAEEISQGQIAYEAEVLKNDLEYMKEELHQFVIRDDGYSDEAKSKVDVELAKIEIADSVMSIVANDKHVSEHKKHKILKKANKLTKTLKQKMDKPKQ